MTPEVRDGAAISRAQAAKARAELAEADRILGGPPVSGWGDPLGRVVIVKGGPGAEDVAAGRALAGPDGEAASKALEALGRDPSAMWATCSRPAPCDDEAAARRLELVIEAVDPAFVLALDVVAAADLAVAMHVAPLQHGRPVTVRGRVLGSVDDLAGSLSDRAAKARVWRQMRAVFAVPSSR